jgi:hypothetical protein
MKDGLYQFVVGVLDLFLWSGELVGEENLPRRGPAVFIANHHEAIGPIATACSIPLRMYTWSIADMVDEEKAAAWLKWDFVERTLHLKPPASAWVARWLSKLTVPFLRSLGCIPVYKGDYDRMVDTLRMSMDILRQGKFLMIFPEDNMAPADPITGMRPFQRSFARLGKMYYQEIGERLEFYPVAVHASGYVEVGKAVAYNPLNAEGIERYRLKNLMEDTVRDMYLQVEHKPGGEAAALTPQHKKS